MSAMTERHERAQPDPAPPAGPTSSGLTATAIITIGGRQLLIGLRVLLAMTVILGIAYPLLILGVSRAGSWQADGSLLRDDSGQIVGSALIGQQFTGPQWFVGRPSVAGYDAMASGGSNLAADSTTLMAQVRRRLADIAAADGVPESQVPPDAVTASGSGLDPDISPAYARIQAARVATARGIPLAEVQDLVASQIQRPWLGFIGQERVNVLRLNVALTALRAGG